MRTQIIALPLINILKSTFKFVWQNKKVILPILPVMLIIMAAQMIIRLSPACTADLSSCSGTWYVIVLSIIFSLINIAVTINYCRAANGDTAFDYSSVKFIKRLAIYVVLLLAILLFAIAAMLPMGIVTLFTQDQLIWQTVLYIGLFIFGILAAPLLLMFPATAMDDYEFLSIQRLFRVAKYNHNALFWGLFLLSLSCFLPLLGLVMIFVLTSGLIEVREQLWILLCSMIIQLIYSSLKGAYYAHIYQFFKHIEKNTK